MAKKKTWAFTKFNSTLLCVCWPECTSNTCVVHSHSSRAAWYHYCTLAAVDSPGSRMLDEDARVVMPVTPTVENFGWTSRGKQRPSADNTGPRDLVAYSNPPGSGLENRETAAAAAAAEAEAGASSSAVFADHEGMMEI